MARPRKTRSQYLRDYFDVLRDIHLGVPYRTISKRHHVGLSTVQRLHRMFFTRDGMPYSTLWDRF